MEIPISFIDIEKILSLHWKVKGPMLLILAWFAIRAVTSLFKFRIFKAAFSVFYLLIFALIFSAAGPSISALLIDEQTTKNAQQ